MSGLTINIREWDELVPVKGSPLYQRFLEDDSSRQTASVLNKNRILNIIELKDGIMISSNSYVGKIKIGDMQINIQPKIEGMPLYKLLKYAYGLRDLTIFDEAIHNVDSFPFHDLLIYQLYAEAEDLIYRGLNKKYVKKEEDLETIKGRIDFRKLTSRNHIDSATMPCSYYDRSEDNLFNRVLLAGLHLAIYLTEDLSLRIRLSRLCKVLEDKVKRIELNRGIILKSFQSIDRLSDRYNSAFELINILFESHGIQLEDGSTYMKLNGFFFDMNRFFQSLLSKLMREYLTGYTIRDEFTLHKMFAYTQGYNPHDRTGPNPRPDFAVMNGVKVVCLLDTKYRDLWETKLPREMLYQLSIYAVSGIGNSTAKILYPSMNIGAKLQKISINNPTTGGKYAEVMLQPLHMSELAQMIGSPLKDKSNLQEYITKIVFSS